MNKSLLVGFLMVFGAIANLACAVLAVFANAVRDDPIQPMEWFDYAFVPLWILLALLFPAAIRLAPRNKAIAWTCLALLMLLDVIPGAGILMFRGGWLG